MRQNSIARSIILLLPAFLSGCTNFTAQRVDISQPPSKTTPRGIFVPDEVPILVVSNGQAKIVMVRSADRGTSIQFSTFLAKHEVELDFQDTGELSKLVSNQDSTLIPNAIIDLAKSVAGKLPSGLGLSKSEAQSSSLQVYKIEFRNGEISRLVPLLDQTNSKFVSVPISAPTNDVNNGGGAGTGIDVTNAENEPNKAVDKSQAGDKKTTKPKPPKAGAQ